MEVKTESGGTFNAAGDGTKALGIIGTTLGGLATAGAGLLGGIMGNKNTGMFGGGAGVGPGGYSPFVTQKEMDYSRKIDDLESLLSSERSERYTDQAIIQYNKDKFEFNKDIANAIVEDRQRISSLEQRNESMKEIMALKEELFNEKIKTSEERSASAVALEAERRCSGIQNLFNYVNGKFMPGTLYLPSDNVTPLPMDRYNTWATPTTTGQ